MESAWSAAAWGAAFGTLNGWCSRRALRAALHKANNVFYAVFVAGFLWRFFFLIASVWILRGKKCIILLPFAGALIFTQVLFEAVPLKKNGIKDNP